MNALDLTNIDALTEDEFARVVVCGCCETRYVDMHNAPGWAGLQVLCEVCYQTLKKGRVGEKSWSVPSCGDMSGTTLWMKGKSIEAATLGLPIGKYCMIVDCCNDAKLGRLHCGDHKPRRKG